MDVTLTEKKLPMRRMLLEIDMTVDVFNGVLHGNDMAVPALIDSVYHTGQGCGLARAGGAGAEGRRAADHAVGTSEEPGMVVIAEFVHGAHEGRPGET